jgi:hypothetical protein
LISDGTDVTLTGALALPAAVLVTTGGAPFIRNFGTFNTFVGSNAGNFTMTGTGNTASGVQALFLNTSCFSQRSPERPKDDHRFEGSSGTPGGSDVGVNPLVAADRQRRERPAQESLLASAFDASESPFRAALWSARWSMAERDGVFSKESGGTHGRARGTLSLLSVALRTPAGRPL